MCLTRCRKASIRQFPGMHCEKRQWRRHANENTPEQNVSIAARLECFPEKPRTVSAGKETMCKAILAVQRTGYCSI